MRSQHPSILVGAFLLGTLLFVCQQAPQAFAATNVHHASSQPSVHLSQPMQDYSRGHTDGYNDCQNGQPHADTSFFSQSYKSGYNSGYQACQGQRQAGSAQGAQEGYDAGYQACQQQYQTQYSHNGYFAAAAPADDSYQHSYDPAWQQGYDECRHNHGDS